METYQFDVIDVQTHIGRFPGHVHFRYSADELVACLDREGVRYALASSASSTTVGQSYGNAEMLAAVERFPDRLGLLVWINPIDPRWEADAASYAERGALGIKLHPVLDTYAVDHESLAPVFGFARRHGLPIVTHAEDGLHTAERYDSLAREFDDVPLVLYHFNARRPIAGILMAKKYPNVYLDTCFVPREAIEAGLDVCGPGKIMFGTDAPIFFDVGRTVPGIENGPPRTFHDCTRDVEELVRSPADRDLVLAGNARRVFKLTI